MVNAFIYICVYIHTCIHAYIHANIHRSQLVREAKTFMESGGRLSDSADRLETMFKSCDVLKNMPGSSLLMSNVHIYTYECPILNCHTNNHRSFRP